MDKQPGFFDGNPKMLFLFGLVTGVALTLILSMGLPESGSSAKGNTVVRDAGSDTAEADDDEPARVLAEVTDEDWVRGDLKKAKVVLVEYSDFECPFCSRHHPTMEEVMDTYGDDVAWVYRHFPLSFHPEAEPSAIASECVGELGGNDAFWAFADAMIDGQEELGDDLYLEQAVAAGVDAAAFTDCYENETYASAVSEDTASGRDAGVSGTPATFVNGMLVSGAVPFSTFAELIDAELE